MHLTTVSIELPPEQLEKLALRVVELLEERLAGGASVQRKGVLESAPELLTISEVAVVLRCSPRSVTRYIAAGRLAAKKIEQNSSKLLVTKRSLGTFIEGLKA